MLWAFYFITVLLIALAVLVGPEIRNTRNWLAIGPIRIQPVELAKLALILLYASFWSTRHIAVARWRTILLSLVICLIPTVLTLMQPDLGSASVLCAIWFGYLLASGLPKGRIFVGAVLALTLALFAWNGVLKDYQRERIMGVFYPEANALTFNYNVIQSKIAIGSAGWWGKGYHQGSQVQLGFLPESATDFVFAAFIEEWGIAVGIILILAYGLMLGAMIDIGMHASQNFEQLIALGAVILFSVHFLVNTGSAVGLFPVVGVPLPLVSYGGSNLLTSMMLLGIMNAIARKR
jgi:rod shape determining protein RodA